MSKANLCTLSLFACVGLLIVFDTPAKAADPKVDFNGDGRDTRIIE